MANEHEAGRLPEALCDEAQRLGLHVEGGEVMFESDIGGGIFSNNWLTAKDGAIRLEVRIIGEMAGRPNEYEELMPGAKSDIIDEARAMAVIQRWGILHSLESRHLAQQLREQKERDERRAVFGSNSNRD